MRTCKDREDGARHGEQRQKRPLTKGRIKEAFGHDETRPERQWTSVRKYQRLREELKEFQAIRQGTLKAKKWSQGRSSGNGNWLGLMHLSARKLRISNKCDLYYKELSKGITRNFSQCKIPE